MSAPLVLYGAHALAGYKRATMPYARAAKRARTAYAIGSYAVRQARRHYRSNKGTYRAAAKAIQRAWRSRKARTNNLSRIGAIGKAISKRANTEADSIPLTINSRTLYFTQINQIEKATDNELDRRIRDSVYIKGFKCCMEFENNLNRPMYFHSAIVYDKRSNDGTTIVTTDDFFRSRQGNERSVDFSTALSSLEFRCLPLNTDRFSVLRHKRFFLTPVNSGAGFTAASGKNYKLYEDYIRLKKLVRWNDNQAQSKIWWLQWFDYYGRVGGDPAEVGGATMTRMCTMYFKDTA